MAFIKHSLLALAALPFIPYLIFQGYYIRKKVPKLSPPEDINGITGKNAEEIKLLCIGESTVAGIGVTTHRDGITGQLAEYLNKIINKKINWTVFAKSGITTKELINKINNEKIVITPDIIVVGIGANDGFRLGSPLAFRKNIHSIIELLQNKFPHAPIVFANLPPISLFPAFPSIIKFFVANTVDIYRNELSKLVKQFNRVYFDNRKIEEMEWGVDERPMTDFFSDGVHPSKLTYSLWAKNIGEFILAKKILN